MNPLDLTSAAAHAHVHDLRAAAASDRLAARAACGRDLSAGARILAALHLSPAADC